MPASLVRRSRWQRRIAGGCSRVLPQCDRAAMLGAQGAQHQGEAIQASLGELSRLFTRLRSVQRIAAAQEVFGELAAFLKRINAEAYRSL